MADPAAFGADAFFAEKWKSWCRLCAKSDSEYINVIAEQEQQGCVDKDLAHIILEYFRVHIKEDDKFPQLICTECHGFVTSLIKFRERVSKVQQMYDDMQNLLDKSSTNLRTLLGSYGVYKDEELPIPGYEDGELPVETIFVADLENHAHASNSTTITPSTPSTANNFSDGGIKDERSAAKTIRDRIEGNDPIENFKDGETAHDRSFSSDSESESEDDGDKYTAADDGSSDDDNDDAEKKSKPKGNKNKHKNHMKTRASKKAGIKSKKETAGASSSDSSSSDEGESDEDVPQDQINICSICSKTFQRRGNYSTHLKKTHGILVCSKCPEKFPDQSAMSLHMLTHRRVYICQHCEQKFERKGMLSKHMKTEHSIKRQKSARQPSSYICEACGAVFEAKKKLKQHIVGFVSKCAKSNFYQN